MLWGTRIVDMRVVAAMGGRERAGGDGIAGVGVGGGHVNFPC